MLNSIYLIISAFFGRISSFVGSFWKSENKVSSIQPSPTKVFDPFIAVPNRAGTTAWNSLGEPVAPNGTSSGLNDHYIVFTNSFDEQSNVPTMPTNSCTTEASNVSKSCIIDIIDNGLVNGNSFATNACTNLQCIPESPRTVRVPFQRMNFKVLVEALNVYFPKTTSPIMLPFNAPLSQWYSSPHRQTGNKTSFPIGCLGKW